MSLIKAAAVFKAELPGADALHNHLREHQFVEPTPSQTRSVGFIDPENCDSELVNEFSGGVAFCIRLDEKVIPGSAVAAELVKRVRAIEDSTGRKPGKKERREIKANILDDFTPQAFVKTQKVTVFHHTKTQYLIVPTTSKRVADACVSLLVQAVASVKTETIHVSDVKKGLTTRITNWLNDDTAAFGELEPIRDIELADPNGDKITIKINNLQAAGAGLREALLRNFSVVSLGFHMDEVGTFRLTKDFRLKAVAIETGESNNEEDQWFAVQAAREVAGVAAIVTELGALMAYSDGEDLF